MADFTSFNLRYFGQAKPLFKLALVTSLLTLITVGIYRFWGKTRIRKYIWSSVNIDGDSLEYTGTGIEKFLGFLVAVVILAIYLGIVQMGLFFLGLNMFIEPTTEAQLIAQIAAIYITIFAVLPLTYFARYRARRYKLARTRWRGIRFGADAAAWGYVWRVIAHGLLSIVTLGIMLPRQTFYLEKYLTDRSHFGDATFHQGGKWTALYKGMKHLLIGLVIAIAAGGIGAVSNSPVFFAVGISVGYIWMAVGYVSYGVFAFSYMAGQKKLGQDISLAARPRTSKIIGIYIGGSVLIAIFAGAIIGVTALIVGDPGAFANVGVGAGIIGVGVYISTLLVMGALSLVLITQPIIAHFCNSITVYNREALAEIGQREADKGADAEGFADALDVGGAI